MGVCFVYLVIMNHFRPYTCMSDFTLQNVCHIQLFFVVFAGLMIKGKVPYLGFESYYRPIEQKIVEVVVIASHACTLAYGVGSILWEKFYSKEQRRLKALETKNTNLRKKRMKKFSRARKNLMAGIRGNLAIKKTGGGFAGLVPGSKKVNNKSKTPGSKKGVGLNFDWPQDGSKDIQEKHTHTSSEESDVDLDHWSSDSHVDSGVELHSSSGTGSGSSGSDHSGSDSFSGSESTGSDHGKVDFNWSDEEKK